MSFSIVDGPAIVANSCNYLIVRTDDAAPLTRFLVGALNSAVLEWRFRLTSSTNHVGNYELDALPLPLPTSELDHRGRVPRRPASADPTDAEADHELDHVWFDAYGLGAEERRRVASALPNSVVR